jgi:type VI secretion system protein ImpL
MTGRASASPQKPWYLVIGPVGAGKSSMLAKSGLRFQGEPAIAPDLATAAGDLVRYWEADDAVFLECAGALVGGVARGIDETAWIALLKVLKRRRTQRPLSGAIVVAPLDAPNSEAEATMRRARQRIAQADALLGARLPVYVVVTKVDLIPGFASYFGAPAQSWRDQVWGVTAPLPEDDATATARLARAVEALREPLFQGLLASLHTEDDPRKSAEIFAFPREFAALTRRLRALLEALEVGSPRQPPARVRGFYLTSAHGFFLKRLFAEVILVEDSVVTTLPGHDRERRRFRQIGAALAAVVAVALLALLGFAFSDQSTYLADSQAVLAVYAGGAAELPAQNVADSELGRAAQTIAALNTANTPRFHLGALSFDRAAQVETARRELATRALNGLLLPRLLVALQNDMATGARSKAEVGDDARLYLMLGGQSPLDRAFAERTLGHLTERLEPSEARAAARAQGAALLAGPLPPIALDPVVSEDAQALAAR